MSVVLLEVDRLLPFCNGDPALEDRLILKCNELLNTQDLNPFERCIKLADAFKHANNHLKSRLLGSIGDSICHIQRQIDGLPMREQVVKRLLLIWECDDAYTKALACIIFMKFDIYDSVECWYRLRQSAKSATIVESGAARFCIDAFNERLGGVEEWREIMHGVIY